SLLSIPGRSHPLRSLWPHRPPPNRTQPHLGSLLQSAPRSVLPSLRPNAPPLVRCYRPRVPLIQRSVSSRIPPLLSGNRPLCFPSLVVPAPGKRVMVRHRLRSRGSPNADNDTVLLPV